MRVFQCRGKGRGGVIMTALKRNILSHLKITFFFFSFFTSKSAISFKGYS